MKKLMIAAAIVCAAAFAQAASCYWTCTYVATGGSGDDVTYADSGKAYFMLGNAEARTAMISSLTEAGVETFNTAVKDAYSFGPTGDNGKYSVAATGAVANGTLGVPNATENLYAYLIITDTEEVGNDTKFYVTDVYKFTSADGDAKAQIKWGNQEEASLASGAWHNVAAVPEPTSGLLLLLGVAGLALRRRRA